MTKHFVSVLFGLASLATLLTGFNVQPNQNDPALVKIEENVMTKETNETDFDYIAEETEETIDNEETAENNQNIEETLHNIETTDKDIVEETEKEIETKQVKETVKDTEKETQTKETNPVPIEKATENKIQETVPAKTDKVVKVSGNEEIKELYKELNNCDENTVYKKIIINGKEYNNSNSQAILDDLINKYGVNLKELPKNEMPKATAPVQTKPEETNQPVASPVETNAPQSSNSNYANEVLELVNQERAKAGKAALTMDTKLNQAAYKRAVEIVSVFSHTRPDGSSAFTVLDEYGINAQAAGENIAWGQSSPSEVVNGWMNSEGHRDNILSDKFAKLGVGVHEENGRLYWTQLFTN